MKNTVLMIAAALALASCRRTESLPVQAKSTRRVTTKTVAGPVKDMHGADLDIKVDPALPVEMFLDSANIGSKVGADGTVSQQLTTFKTGEPVYLTMRFKKSPVGLQSSVRVFNSANKNIGDEFRQMNGDKVVTFRVPPLKAGRYKISGYWGGNVACEYAVVVK